MDGEILCSNTYTVWVLARILSLGERLEGGEKYLGFKIVSEW